MIDMYFKKRISIFFSFCNDEFIFQFRKMFLGLSQSTCTSMAPDPDEILVANSDDEQI